MSKRGSPFLRHAIFLAATDAVERKLTTVIYAVLRDGKPYEPKKFY